MGWVILFSRGTLVASRISFQTSKFWGDSLRIWVLEFEEGSIINSVGCLKEYMYERICQADTYKREMAIS